MTQYELTYFDVRGQGEPIRFLLSYAGKKFEDERIKGPSWSSLKNKMPFGKLPVLEIDGTVYSDSIAICRYLAAEAGIAGDNRLEALKIDQIIGAIMDCKAEVVKIYYTEESKKPKAIEALLKDTLPFYLGRFEKIIQDNGGYLANKKLSWADICLTTMIEMSEDLLQDKVSKNYRNVEALMQKVRALPGIAEWIKKRPDQ